MSSLARLLTICVATGLAATFIEVPVRAETLSDRVIKLEKKTGFFERSVLKRGRKHTRRAKGSEDCSDFVAVIIPLDLKNPTELKVWMTYKAKVEAGAKSVDMVFSSSIGDGKNTFGGVGCQNYRYNLTGTKTINVEAYCSFAANAGDDMFVFLETIKPPAGVCANDLVATFEANAVINRIEMIKPK